MYFLSIDRISAKVVFEGSAEDGVPPVVLVVITALAISKKIQKAGQQDQRCHQAVMPEAALKSPRPSFKSLPNSIAYQVGSAIDVNRNTPSGIDITSLASNLVVLPSVNAASKLSVPTQECDDYT